MAKTSGAASSKKTGSEDKSIKFDTLIDTAITIEDFTLRTGDYGLYAAINFTRENSSKVEKTVCGGVKVVKFLSAVKKDGLLPLTVTPKAFPSEKHQGKFIYSLE